MKHSLSKFLLLGCFSILTHLPLSASFIKDDAEDSSSHLYNAMRSGAWMNIDPETVMPPEEYTYLSSTSEGIMVHRDPILGDSEAELQSMKKLSFEDFTYRLALLPRCLTYCLTHHDDPLLVSSSAPLEDSPSKTLSLPIHAHHFLHHVVETTEHLHFLRKIAPENLLNDLEWQLLEKLVLQAHQPVHPMPLDQNRLMPYFLGSDFIQDIRQFLVSFLPMIQPNDLIVSVGDTPQLPIYVLKRLCPLLPVQPLPISGWAGVHKASSSWLDNIITPHARQRFDEYLDQNIVQRATQPKRLVFLDMVNYGFSIEFTLKRLQGLYNSTAFQTTNTYMLDGLDQETTSSSSNMPNYLVVSLTSPDVVNPSSIFNGHYTSLHVDQMAARLCQLDDIGRIMPHATMRHWDQSTPVIGAHDPGLEPILEHLNHHFAELKL